MNQQELAQYLKPFIDAAANGERVEVKMINGTWEEALAFSNLSEYRIKQKTITVNGFEVPEPMREEPTLGNKYFIVSLRVDCFFASLRWYGHNRDKRYLSRGICHTTKESAIAHAKAMLGIDPVQNIEIHGSDYADNHASGGFTTRCVLSGTKDGE